MGRKARQLAEEVLPRLCQGGAGEKNVFPVLDRSHAIVAVTAEHTEWVGGFLEFEQPLTSIVDS